MLGGVKRGGLGYRGAWKLCLRYLAPTVSCDAVIYVPFVPLNTTFPSPSNPIE